MSAPLLRVLCRYVYRAGGRDHPPASIRVEVALTGAPTRILEVDRVEWDDAFSRGMEQDDDERRFLLYGATPFLVRDRTFLLGPKACRAA